MAATRLGAALRQIHTLFAEGTVEGLTDGQLLERFLARGDALAFEALVARHGPMVLAACRGLLRDPEDVADAFQATFLVLVKKAGSIRGRDALGGWLHRVAHRVAVRANVEAARRRQRERQAGAMRATNQPYGEHPEHLKTAVHEEVARLPEKFRLPVVLCYLEGKTHAQAAAELRWGEATVRRRLSGARDRLRSRLAGRGLACSSGLLATLLAPETVPAAWVDTTIRAAASAAAGPLGVAGAFSATAAALARGVTRSMLMRRIQSAATALLTLGAMAWVSTTILATGGRGDDPPKGAGATANPRPRPTPAAEPPKEDPAGTIEVRGRVLDPEGRPVAGARVYLGGPPDDDGPMPPPQPPRATSGPDGHFRFRVARKEVDRAKGSRFGSPLAALAEGFGPGWVEFEPDAKDKEWSLGLAKDDVPITGRVLDLEGQPVAGATVSVNNIIAPPGGDLAAWLKVLEANAGKADPDLWGRINANRLFLGSPGVLPATRTDADGRYRLTGLGRDRMVVFTVEGPTITAELKAALTTDDPKYEPVPLPGAGEPKLAGPRVDFTAAPARAIVGVVRDKDTGKPIAGVKVWAYPLSQATTDAQGRYRLASLPKGAEVQVTASPEGRPYLRAIRPAEDPPGLGPITLDFELKRGAWVEGRVTDKATGRPVAAVVEYFPMRDNPAVREAPYYSGLNNNVSDEAQYKTDADGRFRAVALPGKGLLAVRAAGTSYLTARPLKPEVAGNVLHAADFTYQQSGYHGFAEIDVPKDAVAITRDIALESGRRQRGTIVGLDGRPVAGTRTYSLAGSYWPPEPLPDATFTYVHPGPGQAETVFFIHEAKRLGGFIDVKGDEAGPLRVQLQPTGVLVGRLVDEDGQPRPGVELPVLMLRKTRGDTMGGSHIISRVSTDRDGRFRIEALVPGIRYEIGGPPKKGMTFGDGYVHSTWWTLGPGETKDWGDVREKKIGAP
jgi:RNA polymerase sigma factor (sigma-70 family)